MAIDLQKFCNEKPIAGYGGALLYRDIGETKYHILIPLETIPYVEGSVDTFDYDSMNCRSKGQVEGKISLDQKDVDFFWTRDNVRRLEALQGRVIDFMSVNGEFMGRTYRGTIKVRPQDASADIHRGIFTITPMSASTETLIDCRDLIQDTVAFINQIPANLVIGTNPSSVTVQTDPDNATLTVSMQDASNTAFTLSTVSNNAFTISRGASATAGTYYGIVIIKATASDMASYERSIAVEYTVE